MARNRRHFHRSSPDMGWVVGSSEVSWTYPSGSPDAFGFMATLFDFADIDPEALTGRIEADKSDWFIKRVLLDLYPICSLDGLDQSDCMRLWQWGLATASNENADEWNGSSSAIIAPEWFNLMARVMRTGSGPVYHNPVIPYAGDDVYPEPRIAVDSQSSSTPAGFLNVMPIWGSSAVHEDIAVSNAGLRNNQSCFLACSTMDGPGPYDWDTGDVMIVRFTYRVLLQKRRA